MSKKTKAVLIIIATAAVVLIAIGPFRLHKAREKAKNFAADQGIVTQYEPSGEIGSKDTLLMEIWKLALWEEKTRPRINDAFGYTDKELSDWKTGSKSGYEKETELLTFAMKEMWARLRMDLDRSVKEAITSIFEKAEEADISYGPDEQAVQICYERNYFGKITEVMQAVEEGAGMKAYDLACYGLGDEWSSVPMDIAFGLRPKLITAGCEAALLGAVKSNDLYDVSKAVRRAQQFKERYHVTVDGLESAKKKEARLEYANKPDIPAVGMTISQARSTKLGAPTETTKDTGSWMHKKHTFGNMYWYTGDRQIFSARYYDGEITEVWDSRHSTAKSPWVSSSGGGAKHVFDPDDHDIEAYFEDNRDEYDDYDDAYEGFLDDEGAWDDY